MTIIRLSGNYGAKNYGRVRELLKLMVKWTAIVGLVCIVLFEAVPGVFIRMFGSADDPVYFDFSVLCLRIYLSLILVTCVQKVCAIFLQSIGKAKAAAPLSILRDALLIVFSLLGGVLADRKSKRNIMVVLDFSTAAAVLIFELLLGRISLVPLMIAEKSANSRFRICKWYF